MCFIVTSISFKSKSIRFIKYDDRDSENNNIIYFTM
jgi:hypothetical protein